MFHGPLFADVKILMDTAHAKVINLNVLLLSRQRKAEVELCLDEIKHDYGEVMLTLAIRTHFQTCSHV